MKVLKKLSYFSIYFVIFGCVTHADHDELIKGNWHSGIIKHIVDSTDINNPINYQYFETFFSDEYYLIYMKDQGLINTKRYTVSEDSILFFHHLSKKYPLIEAKGGLEFIDPNTMIITENNNYTAPSTFYRHESNKKTINNFISLDSIETGNIYHKFETFDSLFQQRFYQKLDRYLKNQK